MSDQSGEQNAFKAGTQADFTAHFNLYEGYNGLQCGAS